MTSTDILTLAERVEAAGASEQRVILDSAAANLALHRLWPSDNEERGRDQAARLYALLNAEAFLDAAMTLLPDDYYIGCMGFDPAVAPPWYAQLERHEDQTTTDGCIQAATLPLALTAAALRAHSERKG